MFKKKTLSGDEARDRYIQSWKQHILEIKRIAWNLSESDAAELFATLDRVGQFVDLAADNINTLEVMHG